MLWSCRCIAAQIPSVAAPVREIARSLTETAAASPARADRREGRETFAASGLRSQASSTLDKRRSGANGAPARAERMADAQLVENPGDDEIDQLVDGLWMAVEARRRRKDHRAGAGKLEHVFEMNRRKRCLAWNEHQRPALLEHHVGGALDQIVRKPCRDRAQCSEAAWADRHGVRGIRP